MEQDGQVRDDPVRTLIAAGCLLAGIGLHLNAGFDFVFGAVLWLILAATIGFMVPSGWMILVAPVPWLVGVAGGVLVGLHSAGFGEAWALPLVLSTIAGAIGVIFGAAARRNQNRRNIPDTD